MIEGTPHSVPVASPSAAAGVETVILCGGRGTRLREYTETIPKMLVEVGGRPILWHIMKIYAHYGCADFVLALGYLGDLIKRFFLDYAAWRGHDLKLHLGSNDPPEILGDNPTNWHITFVDTGAETNTGGRVARLRSQVKGEVFFVTYGDGVSDLDIGRLLDFHRSHGKIATVTAVQPSLSFGLLSVDQEDRVRSFSEKPALDAWINGGFFVFDRRVFDYLTDDAILEREPLERLAAEGQLMAFRHTGFWACMDTYKDTERLNELWANGHAKWKVWQ